MRVGAVTRIIEAWEASGCPGPHQAYAQVGQGAGQGTHSLGGNMLLGINNGCYYYNPHCG